MTNEIVKELCQRNAIPRKQCGSSLQVSDGKGIGVRISAAMVSRIIRALQDGDGEQGIARREGTTEALVRRVRSHELARVDRALANVRVGLAGVIELVAENERDHWQDFLEAA